MAGVSQFIRPFTPLLISVTDEVRIYGLNYKDKREDAVKWLDRNGNAFIKSGHDPDGEVARKFRLYGVPETFVIDRNGRIVHRHTGPISVREWAHVFRPLSLLTSRSPEINRTHSYESLQPKGS